MGSPINWEYLRVTRGWRVSKVWGAVCQAMGLGVRFLQHTPRLSPATSVPVKVTPTPSTGTQDKVTTKGRIGNHAPPPVEGVKEFSQL